MSSKVAALYIRVSTEDQTELSPDAQKRLLLDYAQKNDMIVSGDFIFTESVSGRHAQKRPEFQKMIALAKQPSHPIDVILVWKFSRFARNQEESIVYKSMLKKDNVDVISVSEPLIEGPFGSLIERIIEWMDESVSFFFCQFQRVSTGFVVNIPFEDDFCAVALGTLYFDKRCGSRHNDDCLCTEFMCCISNTLCMVSGRSCN